jgi:CRP-like cAMP-binding protein
MMPGVFGSLGALGRQQAGNAFEGGITQYTDERTIGDYLRRTALPRLTMDFERSAAIFREGEAACDAFVILEGTVVLRRDELFSGRCDLGRANPGDTVLPFAGARHQFSAETLTPVTLMVYAVDRIDRLASIDVCLRQRVAAHRAAHRRFASNRLTRTMNAWRYGSSFAPPGRQEAIARSLKLHRSYATGI